MIIIIIYYLGLEVRAFIRDEAKVPKDLKDKIELIVGDVINPEQVSKAVANRDAVVVVLGTRVDLSMYSYIFLF